MSFYITTPIYYVNDVPHLGHAYTTIVADALARFHRMRGEPTRLLTGTDEHGQKIEEAAAKRGLTAQQLVDDVAPRFAAAWDTLGITYDDFIRTTQARHKDFVTDLWRKLHAAGDLYLHTYQGWYCVGCEAFYTESQLEKGADGAWACTTHKRAVSWVDKERSWFFRLSRFAEPLLAHIEANPGFIQPEAYRNEIVSFIKSGLRDLSVSRTSFSWGIPVPSDTPDPDGASHVMYVWLDALTNYMSALGPVGGALHNEFWPAVHLIGKDILRFHAVYWPCFLLSAGLPLPKTILCHGWWTVRGEKISKSLPATRIDPVKLATALAEGNPHGLALGNDAMRYFLLREIPLGNDGDFTFESLFGRYNAELANDLGNLVSRVAAILNIDSQHTYLPREKAAYLNLPDHIALRSAVDEAILAVAAEFEAFAPSRALEATWKLVRETNQYLDKTKPWEVVKKLESDPQATDRLSHIAHNLCLALHVISRLVWPVMSEVSLKMRFVLRESPSDQDMRKPPAWPTAESIRSLQFDGLTRQPVIFPRLDDDKQHAIIQAVLPDAMLPPPTAAPTPIAAPTPAAAPPPAAAPSAPPAPVAPAIAYADFMKTDLRIGRVLTAAAVPKAKKLLHLSVDLGEAAPRSIVAGIAEAYAPEALVGKQVIVVANLEPATIRGIRSEGMILAAGDDSILGLSALDRDVPPGTRVR